MRSVTLRLLSLRHLPHAHVHWFRYWRDDPFSGATLYACRCGVVRPAP
jgi:hypothetical protein